MHANGRRLVELIDIDSATRYLRALILLMTCGMLLRPIKGMCLITQAYKRIPDSPLIAHYALQCLLHLPNLAPKQPRLNLSSQDVLQARHLRHACTPRLCGRHTSLVRRSQRRWVDWLGHAYYCVLWQHRVCTSLVVVVVFAVEEM
jgi:hypothetical protein